MRKRVCADRALSLPNWNGEMTALHQFYFEHIIKAAGVSFGIIGAVVVYVLNSSIREQV